MCANPACRSQKLKKRFTSTIVMTYPQRQTFEDGEAGQQDYYID
jgi:hypothetical protein